MLRRSTVDLGDAADRDPRMTSLCRHSWFSMTFGRDGLITPVMSVARSPNSRLPLRRLATMQADTFDPASDAAPGKILHETRGGEMALLNEVPFGLYYGSVDSTPLFVLLAGQYVQTTGDIETLKELWPAIQRALSWIDGPGDPDQDGLSNISAREKGLVNQVEGSA
jgi:glycogen debranching enzyme